MMSRKLGDGPGTNSPDEEMRQAFKVFDKDGDGFITGTELKLVMQQVAAPCAALCESTDCVRARCSWASRLLTSN